MVVPAGGREWSFKFMPVLERGEGLIGATFRPVESVLEVARCEREGVRCSDCKSRELEADRLAGDLDGCHSAGSCILSQQLVKVQVRVLGVGGNGEDDDAKATELDSQTAYSERACT